MIGVKELEKQINRIFEIFKERTNCIGCAIIYKDGFIISSIKEEFIQDQVFEEKLLRVYHTIDILSKLNPDLFNFNEKREIVSYEVIKKYIGFSIILRSIGQCLIFIAVLPISIRQKEVIEEYDKAVDALNLIYENYDN